MKEKVVEYNHIRKLKDNLYEERKPLINKLYPETLSKPTYDAIHNRFSITRKRETMGDLSILTHKTFNRILKYCDALTLIKFGTTCKLLLLLTSDPEMWRQRVLNKFHGTFIFTKTWRCTMVNEYYRRGFLKKSPEERKQLWKTYKEEQQKTGILKKLPFLSRKKQQQKKEKQPIESIKNKQNDIKSSFQDAMSDMLLIIDRAAIEPEKLKFATNSKHIERVSNISVETFIEKYVNTNTPVIITDAMENWSAMKNWQFDKLAKHFGEGKFRTDQKYSKSKNSVKVRMKNFLHYMVHQNDEDPIYVFDPKFHERAPSGGNMLDDYDTTYFPEDLFALLGEKKRPRYRWLCIGPKRSGTEFHTDPYQTSAWNAVVVGAKRWALYPKDGLPPSMRKKKRNAKPYQPQHNCSSSEPIDWFADNYYKVCNAGYPPYEVIQKAGEIIYVPSGWWHAVLNVSNTVAVTQNIVNSANLPVCFQEVWDHDRKMGRLFRSRMASVSSYYDSIISKIGRNFEQEESSGSSDSSDSDDF